MKHNFSSFLHQNKGFFVGLALAILSVMPLKSFSNGLNEASAAAKAITEGAIAPYYQNISNPDSAEVWCEKGKAAYEIGHYDEAIECYKKAVTLNPNHADAYHSLGRIYHIGKENYDNAIKYYKKEIELNPNLAKTYHYLGLAYAYGKEDYDNAIKYYKKVIELKPKDADAHYHLAIAYKAQGNQKKAIEHSKKAARLGDEDAQDFLRYRKIEW